ncbi:MAG: hypothetical protein ACI4GY_09795, partial [Acutalibacteraceae bacterium]
SDGKLKFLTASAGILAETNNSFAKDIYSSRLSQELDVEKQTIMTRIEAIAKKKSYKKQKEKFSSIERSSISRASKESAGSSASLRSIKAQKRIIAMLIKNPDFLPLSKEKISEEQFSQGINSKLFSLVCKKIENGESLEFGCFADELSNEEMSALVGICRQNDELPGTKKEFCDCINAILEEKAKEQNRKISAGSLSDEEFANLFKK